MKFPEWFRRPATAVFLGVLLCCSWFYTQGNWNQNARYDMIYSFVEPGTPDFLTFRIDHFLTNPEKGHNTGDWASYDGHYYSNKAPGSSLLGIPVYAALYYLEYPFHRGAVPPGLDMFNAWAINFFVSVLPVATASLLFYLTLLRLGCGERWAAFWAFALVLATPLWPYSTMLWGHPLAAATLVYALFHLVRQGRYDLFFCGLWCGAAVLTDYLALPGAAAFGCYVLLRSPKNVWKFLLGGMPMLLIFAGYHYWCFRAPFTPALMFNNPLFEEAELGFFQPLIALKLLVSSYRGLFLASPLLLAAVPGFFFLLRRDRAAAWCAAGAFLAGFWINTSFNGWHGGTTTIARYLIPVIPFLIFLAAVWNPRSSMGKVVLICFAALSCFNMLAIASTTPMVAETDRNPLYGMTWMLFFQGARQLPMNIGIRSYFFQPEIWEELRHWSSFSLGTLLFGLKGLSSILLLIALFLAVLWPLRPSPAEFRAMQAVRLPYPRPLSLLVAAALLSGLLFPGDVPWSPSDMQVLQTALAADQANVFYEGGIPGVDWRAVCFSQILLLFTSEPGGMILLQSLFFAVAILFSLRRIGNAVGFDWRLPALFLLATPSVRALCRMPDGSGLPLPLLLLATALFVPALLRQSGRRKWLWFFAGGVLTVLLALLLAPPGTSGGISSSTEQLPNFLRISNVVALVGCAGFALAGILVRFRDRKFATPEATLLLFSLWLLAILLVVSSGYRSAGFFTVVPVLLLAWVGIESTGRTGRGIALGISGLMMAAMVFLLLLNLAGERHGSSPYCVVQAEAGSVSCCQGFTSRVEISSRQKASELPPARVRMISQILRVRAA